MNFFDGIEFIRYGNLPDYTVTLNKLYFADYFGIQYNHTGSCRLQIDDGQEIMLKGGEGFFSAPGRAYSYGAPAGKSRSDAFDIRFTTLKKDVPRTLYVSPKGDNGNDGSSWENAFAGIGAAIMHDDHQSSSYDTEFCWWSNIPDNDFAADEDYPWCMGQFVWTGFDYLGEPSPYDTDAWPNHSSVFGIIDLASIPKDRYYLYRSEWNRTDETLHILPHWNWKGREGEVTPVFVYTSYPSAELFVNGISQGTRTFAKADGQVPCLGEKAMERFRLMWNDVVYQPGEIRVVAYDEDGNAAAEKTVRTAGKAAAIKLTPDRSILKADGEDLCYLNVSLTDKDGNPVPADSRLVQVKVSGAGSFKAIANGDPTCLESFQEPQMHLFSGQLTVLVQSGSEPGDITVEVSGKGVKKAVVKIKTE